MTHPARASATVVALTAALLASGPTAAPAATAPAGAATPTTAAIAAPAARAATGFTGRTVTMRLRRAVKRLPVAAERRSGYDRDKFQHWVDANGDCQDTRDEVLDAESLTAVSGCDITSGEWRSYYDGQEWTSSSDVDIDHLVPLAEAWDSGARRWTAGTRKRFANDLADARALVAVTDDVNQAKSDQDPAEWMPALGKCRYVREWVAVKIRWRLAVNRPEKRTLVRRAGNCTNTVLKVRRATVRNKQTGGGGGSANCAAGYSPCVPPPPPDLDCADLDGPIRVTGSDPHNLDGDGDGWGCES